MVKLTRLRALRERKALSQQDLADAAKLSRVAVVRIENGDTSPRPATVRRLAQVLNVEPAELMDTEAAAR